MATKKDLEKMATKEDFDALKLAILELSANVNHIMENMTTKEDLKYLEAKLIEHDKQIYKFKDFVSLLTAK
ncbi:hypothetical protein U473_08425 [Tepidibacillus decaturensis]|uniref:Uncharacterized protein n=2 Tax=Tepidibacillus TaxID=1494427 RepID=A0A135L519_9BACI|nr:hypothetical protein U473_08425 [Tepidibacillus decaturensis]